METFVVNEATLNSERHLCGSAIPAGSALLCSTCASQKGGKLLADLNVKKVQMDCECCICFRAPRAAGWVILHVEPHKKTA